MKLQYYSLFILFLISTSFTFAQSPAYIDSLEVLLKTKKEGTEKVKLLTLLAEAYFHPDPKKACEYNEKAIALTPKDNYYLLGKLYMSMGTIHGKLSDLPKSFSCLDSAAIFFTKADSFRYLAFVYDNISTAYSYIGSYQKRSEYLYKSIQINEQFGQKKGLAYNFSALVVMHLNQNEFKQAISIGKKMLEEYHLPDNPILMGKVSLNIGLAYNSIDILDSALLYLDQGRNYFKQKNHLDGLARIYTRTSQFYLARQQLDSAKLYINKALDFKEIFKGQHYELHMQATLAAVYLHEEKYLKSIYIYDTIRKIAHSIPYRRIEQEALKGLINNYKGLKKHEKVAEYLEAYTILKDSILDTEKQRQIKELEIQYETKKKEQEIILLAKDRDIQALNSLRNQQWAYSAFVFLILVLLISFLLLRQNKLRATQKTAQLKHRLLRNQMNPHFIFNALTAIQSYVYENKPKEAGLYLSSFAKLVRAILENSRKEYILLEKEIQWLENYLKLQLLRFDHQFEYQIDIDPLLDIQDLLIPPMLTQPFIENALEHGLKNIDYKGMITIQFISDKEQQLKIKIEDNGVGYKTSSKQSTKPSHHSLATTITKERLSFLNKSQTHDIHFTIESKEPSGTIVSFIIPLKYT